MSAVFLGSFTGTQKLPERRPEKKIAFLGRSNVGKSSVINFLVSSPIARVSKTPGRTQALNLFLIDGKWILGDFPGFGYAKVSKETRRNWDALIHRYLTPSFFHYALHIVDARHIGMDADQQLQAWLRETNLPSIVLLNKSDKLNRKERVEAERKASQVFFSQQLLFTSTVTNEGKRELEKFLRTL